MAERKRTESSSEHSDDNQSTSQPPPSSFDTSGQPDSGSGSRSWWPSPRQLLTGAVITSVGILGAGILIPVAVTAVGFGTGGIVAGSMAAGIQSTIGNVAAGGLFATVQSAAAGGAVATVGLGMKGAGVAGLAATAAGAKILPKKGGSSENPSDDKDVTDKTADDQEEGKLS